MSSCIPSQKLVSSACCAPAACPCCYYIYSLGHVLLVASCVPLSAVQTGSRHGQEQRVPSQHRHARSHANALGSRTAACPCDYRICSMTLKICCLQSLALTQRCTTELKACARTASPPPISAWQMTCQCAWQYHSYMPLLLLHCSLRRVLLVESSIPLSAVQPGSSYALERRVPCQHGMAEDPPPRLTAHQLHALACTASLH